MSTPAMAAAAGFKDMMLPFARLNARVCSAGAHHAFRLARRKEKPGAFTRA